jgi:cytidylate kinase
MKPTFTDYVTQNPSLTGRKVSAGPFITISRQFGCSGYELADILVNKINDIIKEDKWKVYRKEILQKLAAESGFSLEAIEKARTEKTGFLHEILRNVRSKATPDAYQVRSQIAVIVRRIAKEGYAVIVGQGASAATIDIESGLSVRVEAPLQWRLQRICRREGINKQQAAERIEEVERMRDYLRKTYSENNPRTPAFNITLDNSIFTPEQAAEQIILAANQLGMFS